MGRKNSFTGTITSTCTAHLSLWLHNNAIVGMISASGQRDIWFIKWPKHKILNTGPVKRVIGHYQTWWCLIRIEKKREHPSCLQRQRCNTVAQNWNRTGWAGAPGRRGRWQSTNRGCGASVWMSSINVKNLSLKRQLNWKTSAWRLDAQHQWWCLLPNLK